MDPAIELLPKIGIIEERIVRISKLVPEKISRKSINRWLSCAGNAQRILEPKINCASVAQEIIEERDYRIAKNAAKMQRRKDAPRLYSGNPNYCGPY